MAIHPSGVMPIISVQRPAFGRCRKFERTLREWNLSTSVYVKNIDTLIKELNEREKDIFKERELPIVSDVSEEIVLHLKEFNKLIVEHNKKTSTLSTD